jgi:threonine dehydrogenase-like Zn-dependent dehydrogenase
MPTSTTLKELVAVAACQPVLREYQDGPVPAGHVRIQVTHGAPKHGTEMTMYHGLRGAKFPMGLGNMCVGEIIQVGEGVKDLAVGDRVAGYGSLRHTHTWAAERVWPMPARMTWKEAVCFDPAQFALAGIRDGQIRLGDNVAVFGLGAIGQLVVQMAKQASQSFVAAIDPIQHRRELPLETGADLILDPGSDDVEAALKDATGGRGVDVVVETSANYRALDVGLRALAYGGTVAYVGWAKECQGGLDFGGPSHFNVPNIIFARACSDPNRDHPRWSFRRIMDTCWRWLGEGQFSCEEIVQPVVPFEECVAAYKDIDAHPEKSIKLGVEF